MWKFATFYANCFNIAIWFLARHILHFSFGILHLAGSAPLVILFLIVGCAARPFYPLPSKVAEGTRKPLQTSRPYNLAHRGSNGELPEETAPAYMVIMGMPFWQICSLSTILFICLIWDCSQFILNGRIKSLSWRMLISIFCFFLKRYLVHIGWLLKLVNQSTN